MSIRSPTRRCVEAATPVGIIWKKIDTENKLLTWRTVISYLLVQSSKIHSYFADRESNHKIAMLEQARKRTGGGEVGGRGGSAHNYDDQVWKASFARTTLRITIVQKRGLFAELTFDINIPGSSMPNGWLAWSDPPTMLNPSGLFPFFKTISSTSKSLTPLVSSWLTVVFSGETWFISGYDKGQRKLINRTADFFRTQP